MINYNMHNQEQKIDIHNLNSVYFIGIGGIGVSALAFWCIQKNIKVYGYDRKKSEITTQLELKGATVFYDYNIISKNKKSDLKHNQVLNLFIENFRNIVVYSSAIKSNHPIRQFLNANKGFSIKRAEFLGLISNQYDVIAISGTHGKTTISTILTHILKVSGVDCTAFLGGVSKNYKSNFILGTSNIMVVEADEYDKSFFHLQPKIILISSIDRDHTDTYPTFQDMQKAYLQFILNNQPHLTHLILKQNVHFKSLDFPNILKYSLFSPADYNLNFRKNKEGGLALTFFKKNQRYREI